MNSEILKPCPFCGKDVEIKESWTSYGYGQTQIIWWEIRCEKCNLIFYNDDNKRIDRGKYHHENDSNKFKKFLINRWNKRI